MTAASLSLRWYGVPCHCRCRHCLLSSGGRVSSVPFARAQGVVEQFLRWREGRVSGRLGLNFVVGYCYDFPQLVEYIRLYRQWGMTAADCLQLNGFRMRTSAELDGLIDTLAAAGIAQVGLSFYGLGRSHDDFAGRKGDFDFLLRLARAAAERGMGRFETVFLRRDTVPEIAPLVARLDEIPGCCARRLVPWDYRGRGKLLEGQRPDALDVQQLPEGVAQLLNGASCRTEADWVAAILTGEAPEKTERHYFISIWEDNVERLERGECERELGDLRDADEAFGRAVPPLAALAESFGDADGRRLYALRDLGWKWQDAYLAQHPEIDASRRFDDLRSGVMRK